MDPLPNMTNPISKHAIRIWRITNLLSEFVLLNLLVILLILSIYFHWYNWITIVLWILIALIPVGITWSVIIEPKRKYSYWKYGVNEHFIRFTYGRLFTTQTVIPMAKVQFVELEQGPLLRQYDVHTITIGTLGDTHKIPILPEKEVFALRKQIANYAQIKEVDA